MPADFSSPPFSMPSKPGTYVLILRLAGERTIHVGKLGEFLFPAGWYAYVGSALGPGGLAGRLRRHLALAGAQDRQGQKRLHWHIDYLRQQARLMGIWTLEQTTPREHDWAALIRQLDGAMMPVPRFGASDCSCKTHLFYFAGQPGVASFQQKIRAEFPDDAPLQSLALFPKKWANLQRSPRI